MSRSFYNNPRQQAASVSAVPRPYANRNQGFPNPNEKEQRDFRRTYQYFNEQQDQQSSKRIASSSTTGSTAATSSQPCISYSMLTQMLDKQSDEILAEMAQPIFPLKTFLNDKRMEMQNDWIETMTKLFERIIGCTYAPARLYSVLGQICDTAYLEGVYNLVRQPDSKTNQLRFDFLQSFLNISNRLLALLPHLANHLMKIFERIELGLTKTNSNTPEFVNTKIILDEVLQRVTRIEHPNQSLQIETITTTNQFDNDQELDDYRQLPIVPDLRELLSGEQPVLQKNIIDGVYKNSQHYLDIHFRLLREDFVGPLREGIQQYLSGLPGKNHNVRIYENVHSYGPKLIPRSGIVYDLFLGRQMVSRISWTNSQRLIYGNLLVLTYDKFQTCAFVTVENREQIERTFCVSVRALENINHFNEVQMLDKIDSACSLTMIETMTYFEAYRPVLNALQTIAVHQAFPLEPFILKLTNEHIPPNYVTPTTTYDFTPLLVDPKSRVKEPVTPDTAKYKAVNLLDSNQWPTSDELHLNPKQREALMLALTHKVALIQGPPGTGKTYLGVRIVEMLLHNRSIWCPLFEQSTPILLICQTNHALDQFLELIKIRLKLTKGIIRVGSRCKNEAIQEFSLSNARRSARYSRCVPKDIHSQKYAIIGKKKECEQDLKRENNKIERSQRNILTLSSLMGCNIIHQRHCSSFSTPYELDFDEVTMLDWLNLDPDYKISSEGFFYNENFEQGTYEQGFDSNQETHQTKTYSNRLLTENVNQSRTYINRVEHNEEEEEEERRRDETEFDGEHFVSSIVNQSNTRNSKTTASTQISSANENGHKWHANRKKPYNCSELIKSIIKYPTTLTDETVQQLPNNLWKLIPNQRHDLYRYWLLKYQDNCRRSVRSVQREYDRAVNELTEYNQTGDYYIFKDNIIIAMTTTCAAKCHAALEKLQCKIVIVEEAAAIFEAHIITALSSKCEHLILIGDHVQLRPNPTVYHLGIKYHLDVSLFERLVKNKFPNVQLNIQHRMRPEIARLMKHFYNDLEDHTSVLTNRPKINGVENSVFFINHNRMESDTADGNSKRNEYEAEYIVELAKYLIKQGYRPDQITVLVMYLGQRQYIAKLVRPMESLQGLRIMVTDNYQGEENDIILLSLVRSNIEEKIGFLKIPNRICVALSRARCGLFVIGNMGLLAQVGGIWKKIVESLVEKNEIGEGLSLSCRQHSEEKFIANTPDAFVKRPRGGCHKQCTTRLKCGHQCELLCHNYDVEHVKVVCHKKCNDMLPCGHQCMQRCHQSNATQHDRCRFRVEKIIPECGHKIICQCAETMTVRDCQEPVLKRLVCGHVAQLPCSTASSDNELQRFSCTEPCRAVLACKHKCRGTCSQCQLNRLHIPCQEKCTRVFICSHVCKSPCTENCPPCRRECETFCVHSKCWKQCSEPCAPCKEPCMYKCRHLQCTRLCSQPCNRGPCNRPCNEKLKCHHFCIGICGEPCPKQCRICNKREVQEIIFGDEDEPDARFVLLPDCGHLIEVTALDKFIFGSIDNSTDSTSIRFPECPKCRCQIRRCMRYMSVINRAQNLIEQVKKKILGSRSEYEMREQRDRVIREYKSATAIVKQIPPSSIKTLFSKLESESFINHEVLILLENILIFMNTINGLLNNGKERLPIAVYKDQVHAPLMHIKGYILDHTQYRNFAAQQIEDIQCEFERIRCVIVLESLIFSLNQQHPIRELKQDETDSIEIIKRLLRKPERFSETNKTEFHRQMEKVKHLYNLPGLGINDHERKAIVSALNMRKGHWYVCPKGHPYVITECGGANEESHCPECGEQIGGRNHQLISTNRHFSTMDHSTYAAWSDEANENMVP